MRKKMLASIMGTVIMSVLLITTLFIFIIDYEHEQSVRQTLNDDNIRMINLINAKSYVDLEAYFKENLKGTNTRITYIDDKGKVIYDSEANPETMENHNSRPEVIDARKKGKGSSIRYSDSVKMNMMYFATAFNNGHIIRSSMPMRIISGFESSYFKYYAGILLLVIMASIFISVKLIDFMLKPINELENATAEIAKGDLGKRTHIRTDDEIGHLGKTFNEMADKLQNTLNNSIEQQNRLEAILISMESGIIAIDKNKKIIMINPYSEKIFGIKPKVIGENFLDVIRNHELEDIFAHKNAEIEEAYIISFREKTLRIRTADIINQGNTIGTVAVIQDITDIRKLENMRSQFVANVSHELKTPLTSIKGFAETLRDVDDAQIRDKFLNIINDEAERLTRLINDILILSDIEQHKEEKQEDVSVKNVVSDVYYLMKNTAEIKHIELKIVDNDDCVVIGDSDKFKQMLINLVDNAIKYSESGDKVFIGNKNLNGKCTLWVQDTGFGIPENHVPRLFERFYRVDKARSRANGGTGLGLAIVKHIVLSFKGNIKVESVLGEGSKFTIKIPTKV